jgi:tetratricopeptide (TPR) repeat protein
MTDEGLQLRGLWRWAIGGAMVLLLVYPLARWMRGGSEMTTVTETAAVPDALNASFEHYSAGRYQEAITAAKSVLAVSADNAVAYNNLAVSYLGLRLYDEAIQAAQEAVRLRPDFQLAKNNLTWIQQEKAKAATQAAGGSARAESDALLNLSFQHFQAGRFHECLDAARQSVRLNATSARAFNNISICAAALQQWDEAIRNAQEAIRIDPSLQLARNNLAWIQQHERKAGK